MHTNIKVKNLHPKFETVITHACMDDKIPNLVCELPKLTAVICMNQIHKLFVVLSRTIVMDPLTINFTLYHILYNNNKIKN